MTITEEQQAMVNRTADSLSEHFDSVQIFVTKHSGGAERSDSYETGRGNFYARLGQVMEFLSIQDQYQRNWAVRKDNE